MIDTMQAQEYTIKMAGRVAMMEIQMAEVQIMLMHGRLPILPMRRHRNVPLRTTYTLAVRDLLCQGLKFHVWNRALMLAMKGMGSGIIEMVSAQFTLTKCGLGGRT